MFAKRRNVMPMKAIILPLALSALFGLTQGAYALGVSVAPNTIDSFLAGSFKATLVASGASPTMITAAQASMKVQLSAELSVSGSVTIDTDAVKIAASAAVTTKMEPEAAASVVANLTFANAQGLEVTSVTEAVTGVTTSVDLVTISTTIHEVSADPEMKGNLGQFIKEFRNGAGKGLKGKAWAKALKAEKDKFKQKKKGAPAGAGKDSGKGNGKGK